jgi:hypothetical protein
MVSSGPGANPLLVSIRCRPWFIRFYGAVKLDPPGALAESYRRHRGVSEDLPLRLKIRVGIRSGWVARIFASWPSSRPEPDHMGGQPER